MIGLRDFIPERSVSLLDQQIHSCEDVDVQKILDDSSAKIRRKLHERNEVARTQNHNLMKGFVIEMQNVLLQNLLIISGMRFLINHLTVTIDLKHHWFDSSNNFVFGFTNRELTSGQKFFLIYRINQLWFVDVTMSLSKENKGKSV